MARWPRTRAGSGVAITNHSSLITLSTPRVMKKLALIAGAVGALAACDGFKEAMTAHVDVVAKAGSQELSVTRLADMLGGASVPLNKQNARALANYWVDLQLLGKAAADCYMLSDPKVLDESTWSLT